MRCLALDTTTDICSIGLADESGLIGEYNFAHKMDLSRRLMPNVVSMLKDVGMEVKDVEALGVSLGPGSFTGLRIGVTTAKMLAQTLDLPIVGIVTLDLLAHQFDYLSSALVCPLVKVRKGEVYHAFFRVSDGNVERISDYEAGPISDVIGIARSMASSQPFDKLRTGQPAASPSTSSGQSRQESAASRQESAASRQESGAGGNTPSPLTGEGRGEGEDTRSSCGPVSSQQPGVRSQETGSNADCEVQNPESEIIFCGDALLENLDALTDALGDRVVPAPSWLSYPKASILAQLALEKITAGEADDPLSLVPFYIRRSAPEMRLGGTSP